MTDLKYNHTSAHHRSVTMRPLAKSIGFSIWYAKVGCTLREPYHIDNLPISRMRSYVSCKRVLNTRIISHLRQNWSAELVEKYVGQLFTKSQYSGRKVFRDVVRHFSVTSRDNHV